MFKSARLKLTAWYVVVLSSIVLLFSVAIFRLVDVELSRMSRAQRNRVERFQDVTQPDFAPPRIFMPDEAELDELRRRLIVLLGLLDGFIVLSAGYLGYLLAGKTLSPIEEMMREQDRFVADASHELRTPVTSLRVSMEVALRAKKLEGKEAREVISGNLEETKRLQLLAESLLELSRAKASGGQEQVGITPIIAKAYQHVVPLAKNKKITIKLPKKSEDMITANPLAVERVLVIILDNAIKYSGDNTKIVVATSKAERGKIKISIKDQGIGITKEQLPRVFDRFYRGEVSRSQSTGGYGLGLAIAQELVHAQRGKIGIVSTPAIGSEVTVSFPRFSLSSELAAIIEG